MINFKQYKKQFLKENPNMLDKDIYMSYLFEKELEQFDNVPKPKFKPWGK
jgi:hypothetical protein